MSIDFSPQSKIFLYLICFEIRCSCVVIEAQKILRNHFSRLFFSVRRTISYVSFALCICIQTIIMIKIQVSCWWFPCNVVNTNLTQFFIIFFILKLTIIVKWNIFHFFLVCPLLLRTKCNTQATCVSISPSLLLQQ